MKLGFFGGTFNPIHLGHLRTAEEVRSNVDLDKIVFVPSGNPPLKALNLTAASHRYAMTRLATDSNKNFMVSDMELRQKGKSYTVNTFQKLYEIYPGDELFFILGIDAFLDMPNWRMPDKLIELIDFIVVTRPGFNLREISKSPYVSTGKPGKARAVRQGLNREYSEYDAYSLKSGRSAITVQVTPLDISSSGIRQLIRENKSIKYLLPEAVEEYIYAHKLYRNDSRSTTR